MSSNSTIGSLALGIQIIDAVAQSDLPLKFSDIQEATGISKSNLYKYLNTLTQMDLLYRDHKRGAYSLGYKFLEYGNAASQNADFVGRLTPYFKEISKLSSMTTLFATWVNDGPVITNIWNTNYGLNIGAQVGTKLPMSSASGKIFAAYANSLEMTNWIEREQQTIEGFDISKFQHELKQIRENQFTYSYEPLVRHVSSLGFPILNFKRELVGAFSVVGFSEDVPHERDSEIIQSILAMSKEMSAIYGYKEKEE
ncbi:transcriptional regulator, IclR family [Planococcus glaciei]|uniref:IclR family transcriptional regulator n=1 Tax=Planococcus glaciei TaxID=459472 RepID=UPI0008817A1D|nr:IclR family transcriptional regulator [Planococcus glaciei]SDH48364.1 transcriptional regulator, IclR family [Planococcus glaciei]